MMVYCLSIIVVFKINGHRNYMYMQKLLLLPELSGTAVTGTDSGPVKTTSRSCSPSVMPTLELVNEELINHSGHESLPNERATARVSVNDLTASWTHVRVRFG